MKNIVIKSLYVAIFVFFAQDILAKSKGFKPNSVVEFNFGKDQKGNEIKLNDYKGTAVAIVFWSTSRANSITLLQHFEQIQRLEKDKLKVIAVNVKDERRVYKKIAKKFVSFESSLVYDKKGRYARAFGMDRSEFLVLLNKKGEQKSIHRSYKKADFDARYNRLKKLINEKPKKKKKQKEKSKDKNKDKSKEK